MEQEGGTAFAWTTPFLECPYDHRHPPPKKCRCRGQTFTTGDSDICGIGGRAGCVSCAVRGRGDDGAGVCGPQIQILLITSDSVRFSSFGKTLFENEIHGT